MDSSIRSRQTGQVGSSTRERVGGARGLLVRLAEGCWAFEAERSLLILEGVKGSLDMSGKEAPVSSSSRVRNSTDLMKTT